MTDRLYRSPTDRVIGGVAGGLAVWMNLDPSLVRVAWVILAVLSGGVFVLVYFVMLLVVPLPPPGWVPQRRGSAWPGGPAAPGAVPGWNPGTPGWSAPAGASPAAAPDGQQPPSTWPEPSAAPPSWDPARPAAWSTPPSSSGIGGNAGIVAGIVLILLGAWFLVDRYLAIDWSVLWPVVVIVLGVVLIVGAARRHQG